MKVLLINGSPNEKGCTFTALNEAAGALRKQNIETENVVIGEINLIDSEVKTGCIELLKSGQNRGKYCGCKIILDDLCNRHFKIKNGIIMNNI